MKTMKHRSGETNPGLEANWKDRGAADDTGHQTCLKCSAWRGAFGLEPTPEMYVDHTIEFLRAIRRVLKKTGTCYWNIGDSYWGGGNNRGNKSPISNKQASNTGATGQCAEHQKNIGKHSILKPKDLCLIPFRVAIAAQNDGWWVRSVIIWAKNNPMPESVTDRPTESHEYILLLTKSKNYYFDQEAVREPYTEPLNRWGGPEFRDSSHKYIELGGHDGEQHYGATSMFREGRPVRPIETGRNIRSVWEFPTQPFPDAHFAVFPEELPKRCILAATSEKGNCSKCGMPWVRIVEHTPMVIRRTDWGKLAGNRTASSGTMLEPNETQTLGWKPSCRCNAPAEPALVLDPFAGSGTTGMVAKQLGRRAILIEISEEYCKMAQKRIQSVTLPMGL